MTIADIAANAKPFQNFVCTSAKTKVVLHFNERGFLLNCYDFLTVPEQEQLASKDWEFI